MPRNQMHVFNARVHSTWRNPAANDSQDGGTWALHSQVALTATATCLQMFRLARPSAPDTPSSRHRFVLVRLSFDTRETARFLHGDGPTSLVLGSS
jgi:hypothetical protein